MVTAYLTFGISLYGEMLHRAIYMVQEGHEVVVRVSIPVYDTKVESLSRSMTRSHRLFVQEDPDGVAEITRVI